MKQPKKRPRKPYAPMAASIPATEAPKAATSPAPAPVAKTDDSDPFAEPAKPAPAAAKDDVPAKPAPKAETKPDDDPFAEPAAKKADAAPADKQAAAEEPVMCQWTDDTGDFQVRGKLVKIAPTTVRLLKDTGKYTTVPIERLSQADLQYVRQQIAAAQPGLVGRTAQQ